MDDDLANHANNTSQQLMPQQDSQQDLNQSPAPNTQDELIPPSEPAPSTPPPKPDLQRSMEYAEESPEPGKIVPKIEQESVAENSKVIIETFSSFSAMKFYHGFQIENTNNT